MLDTARTPTQKCNQRGLVPADERCEVPSGSRLPWCVAATLPKAERRAHASLHRFGLETYLPLVTTRWRNRTWHIGPAFPGYLFVRLDLAKPWSPITHAPGVFQLLMANGLPAQCQDTVVEAVQNALQAAEALEATKERWSVGTPCSLLYGPLRGMPAIVTKVHGNQASVAVMMLGQLRVVRIDTAHLTAREDP